MCNNKPPLTTGNCGGLLLHTVELRLFGLILIPAVTIYNMYPSLNLSTTPDLKLYKTLHCTVLEPITGNCKES
jgi:hypothetical protein